MSNPDHSNQDDPDLPGAFDRRSALRLGASLGAAMIFPAAGPSVAIPALARQSDPNAPEFQQPSSWKPLRIGAGGYITGVIARRDGTKLIRTDTCNAYVWQQKWVPLLRRPALSDADAASELMRKNYQAGLSDGLGAYAIGVGTSDTSRIYASIGGFIWVSSDKGASVRRTGLHAMRMRANFGPQRYWGQKLAVDPANADIVLLGTERDGLWETLDGGSRWSRIEGVPLSLKTDLPLLIAYNGASAGAARTDAAFVLSHGRGVYQRTAARPDWLLLDGSPQTASHMVCDQKGRLWVCEPVKDGLRRFENGRWTTFPTQNIIVHSIAVNPHDDRHIWCTSIDGFHMQSRDGGASWGEVHFHTYPRPFGTRKFAKDIPWLAKADGSSSYAVGDVVFDPSTRSGLIMADGVGVFVATLKPEPESLDWYSQSVGIEQIIPNFMLTPPGQRPLALCWDRPIFQINNPDVFPTSYGPSRDGVTSPELHHGWHASHSIRDPRFVVALCNYYGQYHSGFSIDGGRTFTEFPKQPVENLGGSIAVSDDPDKIIVFPSNNAAPVRTADRGRSWSEIIIPGVPTSGERGWGFAYYLKRFILAADCVRPGVFYAYNYGPEGAVAAAGIYESRDYGATWEHVFKGRPLGGAASWHARLLTVPGHANQLFLCSGPEDGDTTSRAKRSRDGGRTWSNIPHLTAVHAMSFGKAAQGATFPAIYVIARLKGVHGVYRSTDEGATWTDYEYRKQESIDEPVIVHGDMNVFGRVFLGFAGSGWSYAVKH